MRFNMQQVHRVSKSTSDIACMKSPAYEAVSHKPSGMIIYWAMVYIQNHLQEILIPQNWDHMLWIFHQFLLKWVGKFYTLMSKTL